LNRLLESLAHGVGSACARESAGAPPEILRVCFDEAPDVAIKLPNSSAREERAAFVIADSTFSRFG